MIEITTFQDSAYSQEVIIDDVSYVFRIHWNHRGQFWSLDILDRDSEPIITGIKLVIAYPLTNQYKHLPIPQGTLIVVSTSAPYTEVGRNDLGVTASLLYLSEGEIAV